MSQNTKTTGLDFDASTIQPAQVNEVLPNGWYNSEIVDAEVLPCKGVGNNERVSLTFKVINGDHANRKFFGSINHKHSKATVQEIGQRELSAVCHATGILNLTTAQGGVAQFIGSMLQVKLGLGKATAAYPDPSNECKGFKALDGVAAPGTSAPAPAPAAAAPVFSVPAAPVAEAAPAAPVAAPAAPVEVSPLDKALADGWIAHPSAADHYYKGQEVLPTAALLANYSEPVTVPEVPAAPVAPSAPATVPAVATGTPPPWASQ